MSSAEQYIDMFDAYEQQTLSSSDVQDFNLRLKNDEEFKKAFEQYKREITLIKAISAGEEMREVMENKRGKTINFSPKFLIPLGAVASCLLIFFLIQQSKPDNQALFEAYFEPFPNLISARESINGIDEALKAYSKADFESAIVLFEKNSRTNDTIFFYKAVSLLSIKEAKLALNSLNQIDPESSFHRATIWYKGLAHLLAEQKDSARFYMKQVDMGGSNGKSAQDILKAIQ